MKIMQAHNYFENEKRFSPLYINSCGYFYDIDYDTGTCRPDGRDDYQLIFITEGEMEVQMSSGKHTYPKGSILLFRPHCPQLYSCRKDNRAAYLWIHFSGEMADELLDSCGFSDTCIRFTSVHAADIGIAQQMMSEITHKPHGYQTKLLSLFSDFLIRLTRRAGTKYDRLIYKRLSPALTAMEQETHMPYSVSEYAAMCNMSEYHFLHLFKSYSDQSPIRYRNDIAMRRAKYLLENTDLPINEISRSVGVDDALYFSKKFRRYFGMTPSDCRKR